MKINSSVQDRIRIVRFVKFVSYGLMVVMFIYVFQFVLTDVFRLKTIEVVGDNILIAVDEDTIPKYLLFFPKQTIRKALLSDHPEFRDVILEKKLPFTLQIQVIPRIPVAKLKLPTRQAFIDESGIIFSNAQMTQKLSTVDFGITDLPDGSSLSRHASFPCLGLLIVAPALGIDTLNRSENQTCSAKIDKTNILFPQHGDFTRIASTLQTLLSRFRMKGTMPAVIDMRFEKPVISN